MMDKKQYEKSMSYFGYAIDDLKDASSKLFDSSSHFMDVKEDDMAKAFGGVLRMFSDMIDGMVKFAEKQKEYYEDKDPEKAFGCGEHEYLIGLVFFEPTIKVRADSPEQAFKLAKGIINGQDVIGFADLDFDAVCIDGEDYCHSVYHGEIQD